MSMILPQCPIYPTYRRTVWVWPFHSAYMHYRQAYCMSMTLPQCLICTTYRRAVWLWPFHCASYALHTGVLYEYDCSKVSHINYIQAYCMSRTLPQCLICTTYSRTVWVWPFHSASYALHTGVLYECDHSTLPHINYIQSYCMSMTLP
jgi:hypothetical protein